MPYDPAQSLHIKAITFDVGNVLVRWDPRLAYEPLFKGREDDLHYFLNEICTLDWHTKHDQGVSFAENSRLLQKQFPEYAALISQYDSLWDNMFGGVIEGSIALLYQLHDLNYALFALTNFAADKFSDFKQAHGFMDLFQDIIVSGEEKITKPDPRIYQILLERTALPAAQTLFIDDRMENIIAAQKCGLQTLVFTNAEQLKTDLKDRGLIPR